MSVDRLEVREIQIAGREFLIGSGVAYFGFKRVKLFRVSEIEFILQDCRAGIAILVGNCVIHLRLGLAIGLDNGLPSFFRCERLALRDRGTAFHFRRINDAFYSAYFPEARAADHKARSFCLL